MRADGRQFNQLRPYSVEYGFIEEKIATGSCRWIQGSEVIAIIYGPNQPKYSRHEKFDRLTINVDCKFLSDFDRKDEMISMSDRLVKQIESIIDCERYPRTHLEVVVHIIQDHGAISAVSFNACMVALLNSGIAMKCTPIATNIAVIASKDDNTQVLLLDPTKDEEHNSLSSMDIVTKYDALSDQEMLQSLISSGSLTMMQIEEAIVLASKCSAKLREFVRTLF